MLDLTQHDNAIVLWWHDTVIVPWWHDDIIVLPWRDDSKISCYLEALHITTCRATLASPSTKDCYNVVAPSMEQVWVLSWKFYNNYIDGVVEKIRFNDLRDFF